MNTTQIFDMMRDAVVVVIKVAGPLLLLSMVVGVIVALFQAVTQIHEQTIGFIFKVTVIVLVLFFGGGWMLEELQTYFYALMAIIAN